MIVFDLRCGDGHIFEAWFGSSEAYADQRARQLIECPLCGDTAIDKAVMAPRIGAKGNREAPAKSPRSPHVVKAAMAALAQMQVKALESSTWVGADFSAQARSMHEGETQQSPIHGQASVADAKALIEDGVPIAPLPFPVVPPSSRN
ncbi:DUF1178 family protein [Sphingomonas koreensis]|nr:DUF1178 family protein [Sphingomonas koreensis]